MKRYGFKTGLAMAGATALALAACDDGRRQVEAPAPAPLAELEAISDLPYAEPARVEYSTPERGYQWAERAYGLQRAFYDTPPDYGFVYDDDVEPYVWETADDWALYAEPYDGAYRYYYYEPGEAYPYFVRDDDYGYAYGPAGVLIAVFLADGRYAPADVAYRLAPAAGRYWTRGHGLREAGLRAPRVRIDDRVWVEDAPRLTRSADPWLRAARDDRTWRAWRERDDDRELARFTQETRRRQAEAQAWRERVARMPPASDQARRDARRELREAMIAGRMDRRVDRQEDRGRERVEARAADQAARQAAAIERRETQADARRQAQVRGERDRAQAQVERRRAQAEQQRQQAQADRQRARADDVAQQRRAQAEQQRQARGEQQRQQAQAERGRAQAERQRARAEQRRQAEAQRQQARANAQAEQRQAQQAARQQAQQQAREGARAQRQQQAAEQHRAQHEARQAREQPRAPSAAERGQPAADRGERGKGRDKKD